MNIKQILNVFFLRKHFLVEASHSTTLTNHRVLQISHKKKDVAQN